MIIDLERNDLGRVAGLAAFVQIVSTELNTIKVSHATAEVKAILAEGRDVFDAITPCFPADL